MGKNLERSEQVHLVLLDWSRGGHDLAYLRASLKVMENLADKVSVFSGFSREDFSLQHPEKVSFESVRMDRSIRFGRIRNNPLSAAGKRVGLQVQRLAELSGSRIQGAFFPTMHDWEGGFWKGFVRGFNRPWAGLAISWRAIRAEENVGLLTSVLSEKQCQGVAVLDERRVDQASRLTGGKPVVSLPDFVEEVSVVRSPLCDRIAALANGRPIVLMLGQLNPRKGIPHFGKIALHPQMKDHFFVLAGRYEASRFSQDDRVFLEEKVSVAENVYFHPFAIQSDSEYRSILKCASVSYALFPDFPHSSNTLSLAATLSIPVLVSGESLLGERVREFSLGECVSDGVEDAVEAVRRMTMSGKGENSSYELGMRRFAETVREENFMRKLESFLVKSLELDG